MYDGREVPGWIIPGPLSAALSGYLGREVHLFRREPEHIGHDDQPVTLMSEASLKALAPEFNGTAPDPRRFRMTIAMTGTDAWAEHGWGGQKVSIGEAIVRVIAPVPRCVVTTRNPDSGGLAPRHRAAHHSPSTCPPGRRASLTGESRTAGLAGFVRTRFARPGWRRRRVRPDRPA
jgi:MOSC domain-containing protein